MSKRSIWLLSAYRADSHAAWADWLIAKHQDCVWQRLELAGRHFRWRIRGNPLSWLDALPDETPDLIVATSMVDWATLKGLHPRLAAVPCWYYFHENQFAYPVSVAQFESVEPQMVQLYGALAAQRVLFNSAYNRDSFLDGVEALLRRLPDALPQGIKARLAEKCGVLPVVIEPVAPAAQKDPRLIVWNHRWEYDKAPDVFADAMLELAAQNVEFRLALLGARPSKMPPALARLREALADRIVVDGKVDARSYREHLGAATVVVSTALHEFQGLAMLEAVSAGARPLVPDALCYPEQYPAAYRYPPGSAQALAARLAEWFSGELPPAVDVSAWHDARLHEQWRALLEG